MSSNHMNQKACTSNKLPIVYWKLEFKNVIYNQLKIPNESPVIQNQHIFITKKLNEPGDILCTVKSLSTYNYKLKRKKKQMIK